MFLLSINLAALFTYVLIFDKVLNCAGAEISLPLRKSKHEPRILNGSNTTIDRYPSAVSLIQYNPKFHDVGSFICGGCILSKKMVLTAAHCVVDSSQERPTKFKIRAGSSFSSVGGDLYNIKRIIVHNKYKEVSPDYDFALLETHHEILFNTYVKSAPIVTSPVPIKSDLYVVGWGMTESRYVSEQLKFAKLFKMRKKECQKRVGWQVTKTMFCATDLRGKHGSDTCSGDSGGPIFYNDKVAGVTSWGPTNRCTLGHAEPGVYADVYAVSDWIKSIIE